MIGPMLVAAAVIAALWAVREGRRGHARHIGRALAAFALAVLAQRGMRALAGASAPAGVQATALALSALAGLVAWTALAWLAAFAPRRRDLFLRAPFAVIALLIALTGNWIGSAAFMLVAVLRFRWSAGLPTLRLFHLALGAAALVVVSGWRLTPLDPALTRPGPLAAALEFARWARVVSFGYLLVAVPRLLWAFLRDPSLGIRTAGRRLALSHVLVVAVPLALLGALWMFTTVLGVGNERAMVGARMVAAEGRQLEGALRAVLARSDGSDAALRALPRASADRWPGLGVWRVRDGAVARLAGDSLASAPALARWVAGLDSLPASGVVLLLEGSFLGAAARATSAPGLAAVALAPIDSVLTRAPSQVAGARLRLIVGAVSAAGGAVQLGADDISLAAAMPRDSLASGEHAPGPGTRRSSPDSARLARARASLRAFGLPDSLVQLDAAGTRGLRITSGGETYETKGLPRDSGDVPFLLQGHALVEGIILTRDGWVKTRPLLAASARPLEVLTGLYRNTRDDPLSLLPLGIVLALTLSALLVIVFDVVMVTGMGRSITAAIQALKVGARRLESGDLSHRIAVAGDDDLWEVASTFNQASAGLEHARELEKEAERLEGELALARRIQARLLPAGPPVIEGLEIAGLSEPAREVGGDYFDHIPLGDGRVMLVIADVSGKGVGAALLMSAFRASLMSQDSANSAPDALAGRLNEFLHRSVDPGKFVTAFVAFLDGRDGRLVYANAGHNPPVLLRRDGAHLMLTTGGLILGILPGSTFECGEAVLAPGDLVALYTDGVTEGANATGEQWGEERLLAALRARADAPCVGMARAIVDEVRAFEGESGPADDITLLVARRVAGPPASR